MVTKVILGVAVVVGMAWWLFSDGAPPSQGVTPLQPDLSRGKMMATAEPPSPPSPETTLAMPEVGPEVSLAGVVRDAISGEAVAAARVQVVQGSTGSLRVLRECQSDAEGRFEFFGVSSREKLRVSCFGYLPFDSERQGSSLGSWRILELVPGTPITGEVRFRDGTPVAGGAVLQLEELTASAFMRGGQPNSKCRYFNSGCTSIALDDAGRFQSATNSDHVAF